MAAVAPLVGAGPAAAETTLQVEPGYAGSFVMGRSLPVRVRVSADRLVRASLEVAVGTAAPVATPVEVPGGSQKQFLVVASTGIEQAPTVVVRLVQDGRLLASGQSDVRMTGDQELVGLLPGALHGRNVPGPAALAVDAGTARFAAVGEAELQAAPASLGPLSTLAADADELVRLAPEAREGVLAWVQDGGRLLVDTDRGRVVPGLPDAWQPGPRGRAPAGLGEVVATEGALAAGRWANLVEPTNRASSANRIPADASVAGSLASEAGLRSPRLGWLVGFLVVYVLLVGPVLFVAVRRRGRPELAWVAVPLVAVLFSTGSYAVGRNIRKATQLVHGTVLSTGPAGPAATTYVGIFSRGGQTARVGFPAGWTTLTFGANSGMPGTGVASVNETADGPEARVPLDAGQFAMVEATGPAPDVGGLEVSAATGAGGLVTGTVRNTTKFTFEELAVFAGLDATIVGTLGPGDEKPWTVANPIALARAGGGGAPVWSNGPNIGSDAAWDPVLWQAASQAAGPNFRGAGAVVAAGWTRDYAPTVRVDGRSARPKGKTVIVARAPVRIAAATDPLDFAVRQDVVRDPFNARFGVFGALGPSNGAVVRFVLPPDTAGTGLVLHTQFAGVDFWSESAWQPADGAAAANPGPARSCGPIPCPPDPMVIFGKPGTGAPVPVPASAVRNGVLYARVAGPVSPESGFQITLGRAT